MQFALVGGERAVPVPGSNGTCPACGASVVARCGTVRVHHWAHRVDRNCDPWWEHETQWHREWKNLFGAMAQEIVLLDASTGEKHVADVRTKHGLVIEFQHSSLKPEERVSREAFYKNMVWVVDGARLKNDLPRFQQGRALLRNLAQGLHVVRHAQDIFPKAWTTCQVPVLFDFLDDPSGASRIGPLYCLLPGKAHGYAVVAVIGREDLVRLAEQGPSIIDVPGVLNVVARGLIAEELNWIAYERARLAAARRSYTRMVGAKLARQRSSRWTRR